MNNRRPTSFFSHPKALSGALAIIMLLLTCVGCASSRTNPDEEEWIQLFNGTDLDDWNVKITGYDFNDNFGNTFRVEDGLLKARYDEYDEFGERYGHIFHETPFSHYVVAVEYRFVDEQVAGGPGWAVRNSGVMVHSQDPRTMLREQDFPISIEAQLLGGTGSGERSTANLCTPGTHVVMDGELVTQHCVNSSSDTYHGEQWVRAEIVVLGDSLIRHVVEGEPVLEYTKPQIGGGQASPADPDVKQDGQLLTEGYIALQSESHPVDYRTVEVLNLKGCMDPEATNYKSYYVAPDNASCQY